MVFIIEGIPNFLFPVTWKRMLLRIDEIPEPVLQERKLDFDGMFVTMSYLISINDLFGEGFYQIKIRLHLTKRSAPGFRRN